MVLAQDQAFRPGSGEVISRLAKPGATGNHDRRVPSSSAGGSAQVRLTLIKQFLNVVLVRLVPADAVKTFCGQTCKHKQVQVMWR